jgi:S-DNA-T family DNA segregation ATPase FtsK/SpoIIIE
MGLPLFAPRRPLAGAGAPDAFGGGPRGGLPANTRLPTVLGAGAVAYGRAREAAALVVWTAAAFLALSLASYRDLGGDDWVGPAGAFCAKYLVAAIGVIAWLIPVELAMLGVPLLHGRASRLTYARAAGDFLIIVILAALVQVCAPQAVFFGQQGASGVVGELFGEVARSLFSTVGSYLVGFALLGLILIGRASFSFIALVRLAVGLVVGGTTAIVAGSRSLVAAWREARELELAEKEARRVANLPRIELPAPDVPPAPDAPSEGTGPKKPRRRSRPRAIDSTEEPTPEWDDQAEVFPATPGEDADEEISRSPVAGTPEGSEEQAPKRRRRSRKKDDVDEDKVEAVDEISEPTPEEAAPVALAATTPTPSPVKRPRRPKKEDDGPTIVDTSSALEKETERAKPTPREEKKKDPVDAFKLPPIDFLVPAKIETAALIDKDALYRNAELLIKTLADYRVQGKVEDILPGPTVTTYEVSPAAGTKVSKVASLADDLALALARKVRIVAPIPGKNRIGFELPNERRVPVNLRDLIEDRRFQALDVPLPVVLGRDILGNPVYADLASMPHVIVAGATGAGKSVGLNVMLTSLLYQRTPEELRLLMIDPKVVELAPFDRIPHMLLPVVTDMKQAATALKWAVDEMERRYQLFADAGTKNIGTYNGWVARVRSGEVKNPFPKTVVAKDHNGLPENLRPTDGEEGTAPLPDKLPLIVIVVDEFADLMIQQGKEVEVAVARLAQKARAAGMHVILATQRPSVDVITGMIKANFPTRIAFRVAQKVDSRTILDEQGAEHLLGRGDMLIKLNGTNETRRVQCPWVSEEEVSAVTDFLRAQGEPVYDENILKPRDEDGEEAAFEDAEQDEMYDAAVRLVAETRRCSTSWLQRKLSLGYNRAARIVEMMERRGLVGPSNGAKDREVLIDPI